MKLKYPKKRINKSDIILMIIAITTLTFVSIMIWLFYLYQSVPDTLIGAWFGFISLEGGVLGWIKNTNIKQGDE